MEVSDENICEWDVISDIFSKTIKRKNLSDEQIRNINDKIKFEMKIDEKSEPTEEFKEAFGFSKEQTDKLFSTNKIQID